MTEPPRGFTVWFTGLPSSGKRSVARRVAEAIRARGLPVERIDSGKLRRTPLGSSLGFSRQDRDVNVRRHALAAHLLARNGVVAVVSAVSPYRATREAVRRELGRFVEVHVATPPEVCRERDARGLWERALAGEIRGFTGVDDPYEPPEHPECTVDLSRQSVEEAAAEVVAVLEALGYLPEHTQELAGEDDGLLPV